jgi:hypothetical protein
VQLKLKASASKINKTEDSADTTLKLLLVARPRLFMTFPPYFSQVLMITNVREGNKGKENPNFRQSPSRAWI